MMLSVLASCTSSGTNLAVLEVKRVHSDRGSAARFWVLLGGEFLCGLDTRWKLSWRYELAGSFPVRRPGVNQGPSQRERPLLPYLLLLLFFYNPSLLTPPHLVERQRNSHFSLLPHFPPLVSVLLSSIPDPCFV